MLKDGPISAEMQKRLQAIQDAIDLQDEPHVVLFVNQNPELSPLLLAYTQNHLTSSSIRSFLADKEKRYRERSDHKLKQ